jgi:hypothetical protein
MKTESIEDFLKRGGEISKSSKIASLEEILYSEGLLDHNDAKKVQANLSNAFNSALDNEFSKESTKED